MNKRLAFLEQLHTDGKADSFALYGLAMEYRKLERVEDSLRIFEELREKDSGYLAMYLMAGQLLIEANRGSDARVWLEQGIELATRTGNGKALGELQDALEDC
ncbi:MAG: hypothetical protein AB7K71_15185 [Polyangiaceae bacterium]